MPSRKISHDELSLLLFVYLGMGSDIMELLVLFEEDYVLNDDIAIYATLSVWSASLLQFIVVLTATRRGQMAHMPVDKSNEARINNRESCVVRMRSGASV